MENNIKLHCAIWSISLDTVCPGCQKEVNLLDYADFWDCRNLDPCENGTKRSSSVEVICPECGHEFSVFCVY
jgi:endogenous inhibitor of DNA gyrase (YacG/DUF329 family)